LIPWSEIVQSREEFEDLKAEARELGVPLEVLLKVIVRQHWRARGLKLLPHDTPDELLG
jgi:uncharacterized protein (DUF111 family)